MGAEHSGRLFHLTIRWLMRKDAAGYRLVHAMTPVHYEKNKITTLRNDSTTASGLQNSYC